MRMARLYMIPLGVLLSTIALLSPVLGGEGPPAEPEAERPGLRMDPMLVAAASQFAGGELPQDTEVVPELSVSGAEDGYTVRRYAVMKNKKDLDFYFFRVLTLVGSPTRDVAVKFADDGTLENAFDLRPPPMPKEAPKDAKAAPKPAPKPAEGEPEVRQPTAAEIEAMQKAPLPTLTIVLPLVGRHTAQECQSLAALMAGLARAEDIAKAGGKIELPPLPADAFRMENPLPKLGTPLPNFQVTGLDGKPLTARNFRGKAVAFYFTALESVACAEMNQVISEWIGKHAKASERLVLVLMEKNLQVKALLKDTPLKGQGIVCDPMADLASAFKIEVRPMVLLYDRRHRLSKVVTPDNMKMMDTLMKGLE